MDRGLFEFEESVRTLLLHPPEDLPQLDRQRLKVVDGRKYIADTNVRRRGDCYVITVHRGLYSLFYDTVCILLSWYANALEDWEDASSILRELLRDYVYLEVWPPSRLWSELAFHPHLESSREWSVLQYMIDFAMAHELGHILSGHCDCAPARTRDEQWKRELEADRIGTILYANNLHQKSHEKTMKRSDYLRGDYLEEVRKEMKWMAAARVLNLTAVAILFELLSGISTAARGRWGETHPPGIRRYRQFRKLQIDNGWMEAREFDEVVVAGLRSPESTRRLMRKLINYRPDA